MEALERAGVAGAADPEGERVARVGARLARGELAPDRDLLRRGPLELVAERRIVCDRRGPPLDPAHGLEPGDGGDEMAAGEVVGRRERLPARAVGSLLGDGRATPGAACDDPPEGAGLTAELERDDGAIVHGADA